MVDPIHWAPIFCSALLHLSVLSFSLSAICSLNVPNTGCGKANAIALNTQRDGIGALRSIVRPLSRTLISRTSTCSITSFAASSVCPKPETRFLSGGQAPWSFLISNHFHSLTDTRFPKRRPSLKSRRKRASIRPPGPYAGIQCAPGEPIVPSRPNEGSVKRRNEKKRNEAAPRIYIVRKEEKKGSSAGG
ncbi:uncharacterized protein Pyn_13091 [Prunus yedoensis var. nudiflora]|uniref:Uncharacterized protein n=1 Tax=Prunus yedoensis var. nudiflora TaxID=2094558 RepID=A0A314Y2C2_PRUYE|nr:uncharacterized protein Pyn_13091 [Prunus yedoensis var. nudiflora]